jgi:serine/threonine-protein kinase
MVAEGPVLPPSLEERIDQQCDRFEKAWQAGERPRIEDYLQAAPEADRAALFRDLLALELELRANGGETLSPRDYQARFPEQGNLIQAYFVSPALTPDAAEETSGPQPAAEPGGRPVASTKPETTEPRLEGGDSLPAQIGRYQVLGRLGGGTYGEVYLAQDDLMKRRVAIKVPSPELLATHQAKEQFLREAQSVAGLDHDAIVRVHDFGQEADGPCYIVYQYVEGCTLAERIKPESAAANPLAPQDAMAIVMRVAEALHHAHLQGLVHRDVKPANILLDREGQAKLADFGLAVREENLPGERGRRAGTLPYMAPEQIRRESHLIDGRADIYSLGVVLYELLAGQRPFRARSEEALEEQILHREARPLRQIKDSIPRPLETICLKALSKDVRERYRTARDMADELKHAIRISRPDRPEIQARPGGDLAGEERAALDRLWHEQGPSAVLKRLAERAREADEKQLRGYLRYLRQKADPAAAPFLFSWLGHPAERVRTQARKALHAIGWERAAGAVELLARRGDAQAMTPVLDGLGAFEAHVEVVALLDRLVTALSGDLRNRAILLLERKRLGLELERVAELFREIQSPYQIDRVLGQGLITASYLAQHVETGWPVVVRVLRPELASQPALRSQFLDLSKKSFSLVHENLLPTREVRAFTDRNFYFSVRDYVEGVTLQKVLEAGKKFEPLQAVRILQQTAAALTPLHRQGMSHGGIKPSNIFLCEGDRLVLGDPALPAEGVGLVLARLSYDYRYAAPEWFQGGNPVGQAADQYALGCVAYELACGTPPFIADHYLELTHKHTHETIAPPSKRGSSLGAVGDQVLLTLLARQPGRRFVGLQEVLDALSRLEQSLSAGPAAQATPVAPILQDTSLARYRASESVLGFDASVSMTASAAEPQTAPEALEDLPAAAAAFPEIPGYTILEILGRGGMGIVYKARQEKLGRLVVLKGILKGVSLGRTEQGSLRQAREGQVLAILRHPHIVQIFDIVEDCQGTSYLAMEFVEGGTLRDRMKDGLQPVRWASELVCKLAQAVQHAHAHRILHRDLKPTNILMTPEGEPKISDFGLAKIRGTADQFQTMAGTIIGTPAYMAPEQARGEPPAPAVDIYALGGTLYELLTGHRPYEGATVVAILELLVSQPPAPPTRWRPEIPRELEAICLKCLAKLPGERYPSAGALEEDLERWLRDEPISARPAAAGWRRIADAFSPRKWARKR